MKKYLSYEETKSILPKNLLEKLLIEKTYREIAKLYGANERIISRLAQETYHIPKNNRIIAEKKNENKIFNIEKTELEKLYVNQKMSAREIGKLFGVQHTTIIKKLKYFNIEIRPFNYIGYYDTRRNSIPSKYVDSSGYYVLVINDTHIREHRYVMEQHIGRCLVGDETVHHIDFDKLNNDISNLFLFEKQRYHKLYHYFVNSNNYINPKEYLYLYKNTIDLICEYDFLYNLYINQKMSANAIHKFIFDKFSFDLDRVTIIKLLKEYGIFEKISPTINQYDKRICVSDL